MDVFSVSGNEIGINEAAEMIRKQIKVVDSIFEINSETVDEVFTKIKKYGGNFDYFSRCIEYVIDVRPKQSESLYALLYMVSRITNYKPRHSLPGKCLKILIKKGIIKENDLNVRLFYRINEEEDEYFTEGSIEKAIMDDDVEKLIKITSEPDFEPLRKLKVMNTHPLYYVTKDINDTDEESIEVSFMQLMAFFGSIKCFKYALIEDVFDNNDLNKYAVAGGSKEIIQLLERNGVKFDDCYEVSIKYHRNEIGEWLKSNYRCESIPIYKAVNYFNDKTFLDSYYHLSQ